MRRTPLLRFGLLIFLTSVAVTSRAEVLPLRYYTTSDGLAHDRVNRIVRDSRGFLWFCTGEGLSRFDGYQFKNYTRDDGLPHRTIRDLLETPDGNYWVATGDGLVLFNPQGVARRWRDGESDGTANGESLMFRVFHPYEANRKIKDWSVARLQIDGAGTIWAATSHGLYRADRVGREWKLQSANRTEWGGALDLETLLLDRGGVLWLAGNPGVYRILLNGRVQTVSRANIISLLEDRAGNIWAGTRGDGQGGLYQYAYRGLEEPRLLRTFTMSDGLSSNFWLNHLLQASDGTFWVGVGNALCQRVKQGVGSAPAFRKIWEANVLAMEEDIGGNLWIGTESSGAVRLSRNGFQTFDEKDGLRSPRIRSVVNGIEGEVFALSSDRTIHRFDGDKFTAVSPKAMGPFSWDINQITFQDRVGEWWVAGTTGLQRYPKVDRLEELAGTKPKRLYTIKDGLPGNFIFHLFEDSRGDIWFSALGGRDTLARWERQTDKIQAYTVKDGLPDANAATAFAEDHFGNLWIGHYSGGLVRYRNGVFQAFTGKDGLPAGYIRAVYADSAGRVWIASSTGGLARIDEPNAEQPAMVTLSTAEGLSSNQITCITEDKFGRIYLGTGRGVNRLDTQTGRIKLFTSADGLPENLVQVCERDQSGALWFGFHHGLSRFIPEPDAQPAPPPIFISDVIVNGTSFKKLSELGNAAVENLELAPDQRQIQINFFALGFATGETLRYQYKLDDTDWSALSALRAVNLNLSPGTHRFLVRAVNAEGVSSVNPAVVSLSIARPVWQRWWFISLSVFLLATVLFSVYRYRMARLREVNSALREANLAEENLRKSKEERLRELELVRKRIASDLHDDIGSSLTQISLLSEVVNQRIDGSDVGVTRPLTMIANSSRELVDAMSDIVWAINPQKDHLSDLTQRMRSLISDLSTFSNIRFSFRTSSLDVDLPLGANLRREIFLIFKESVNNIVKHSGATEAELEFRVEGSQLFLSVTDNGRGFDLSQENDGHGLISMRARAEGIGGRFELVSAMGKGTIMIFRAPLEESMTDRVGS